MKLKNLLSILLLLPLICSCQEDNIEDIFVNSGTWNVGNFYVGGKWEKNNDGAKAIYQKNEDIKALNQLTVIFHEDGVISGKYLFTDKHIIYSKIRPNLNKVALPDFDGLCSADAYPILPKTVLS